MVRAIGQQTPEADMSSLDRINRARWSLDQRQMARANMTAQREQERVESLAALRHQLAEFEPLAGDPLADRIIANARAGIARLSVQ
jgi:hypothetical protein